MVKVNYKQLILGAEEEAILFFYIKSSVLENCIMSIERAHRLSPHLHENWMVQGKK